MSNATPLHEDQRRGNYIRSNSGRALTPKQRRRWKHKLNRALKLREIAQARAEAAML